MTSILLEGFEPINLDLEDSEQKSIITGVSWKDYELLLNYLRDSLRYRITYLDGTLEIMSPSRSHEFSKKNIARLLEAYLNQAEIDYWGYGSTTFRKQNKKSGKEPDECYCIGTEKEFPDLAIEVIVSSGGVDNLEVYKRLGIKEIWFWQNDCLTIYYLNQKGEYQPQNKSVILPELDVNLLASYVTASNPRIAVKEFLSQISSS
ncbi:MAG: Uma2 family endonuclease [Xenococcaceae cyanobacterium MO_188.B32]|nr:Uma2 family endonuclease [Xenococcaceae cyanobacterium MO_188.B32]